jgi:tRNA threonylcarbamoyladenosine biosynthesis protein TsaE
LLKVVTGSVEETIALGEKVGMLASAGDFIALTGELGSGKTHFTRGVAAGLGIGASVHVTSPTYTLVNTYAGRLQLHHFDLYRLAGEPDVIELGFEEYFYGSGVCIVEWAERLQGLLPVERLSITFTYVDENTRTVTFAPHGVRYEKLLENIPGRID